MRRLTISVLAIALICCAVVESARAQNRATTDANRDDRALGVSGRVLAPDGGPIVDARVEIAPASGAGSERATTTDATGDWRLGGLGAGIWRIEINADGYQVAQGKVDLRAGRVELETTLEVDADQVVRGWLEEANALLAAGDPVGAQDLYERALSVVPLPQSPPIHQALARTHFLQGRLDEAVRSLQRALLTNPADAEARQLLPAVLGGAGREEEAHHWLGLLDGEGVSAAAASAFAVEVQERELAADVTGRFRTRFDRGSEMGTADRLLEALGSWERLGVEEGSAWSPAAESFELYVPEAEAQRDSQAGYGVLVWISPTPQGRLTDPEMTAALEANSMIWIGANRSGNSRPRADRMRLALDAVDAVSRAYPVDPERVYVAGYSGGGRMASTMALHFPDVFAGGIYFMGVDFYRQVPKVDQPGTYWGPVLKPPTNASRAVLERRSRFVFITGAHDFNRAQTHAYRDEYRVDGLERVHLIEIPRAGHYHGFKVNELDSAIAFLDQARP